ncbi:MAG: 2-succinyl-5-enolpyruvyl-6-hydroxy-3-cyclohexene-1-carboxylic-acid synthase [Acidimicrobiia bacterium]|nr:2-succinyl-5-enolpyruvyl-6-hydroxy-3-cyclohexene-1-carboxylic-acid synthase [Acidimicrobiia bacterium]MYC58089.1 2-succinyl-5-enolpyruvyl-6-hydroxy-3-cyclohexene-1-carboxylic-acid synthase [Acidimicrobiia bacterium]MYI30738.1 2-succinyl-5-enolpyruvyl-6-hydroxy-3-cyclohexene-1-carboxylic-acid synthase [Acidimicrobiia bacterium]
MSDLAYRAAALFWAEVAACGVTEVVVSPGSRSTPLTVMARHHPLLRVTVCLDERVGGFCAVGMAKASGRTVALVCTSGTAAANYLPAVVEAHHSGVPLLVCTADRPPELRGVGAGQTIDQTKLYGQCVRWHAEVPCDYEQVGYFNRLAVRAVTMAGAGPSPGPVHLNWPFRKPLEPQGPLPTYKAKVGRNLLPVRLVAEEDVEILLGLGGCRGLIVAGAMDTDDAGAAAVVAFAKAAGWPVLADAGSQLRGRGPLVLDGAEWLLGRAQMASEVLAPEVLIRIGGSPSNWAVSQFMESCTAADRLLLDPSRRWEDPSCGWTKALASDPVALFERAVDQMSAADPGWSAGWMQAADAAWQRVEAILEGGDLLEPLLVTTLLRALPPKAALYVSNSMPVRDVSTFWPPDTMPRQVLVNRGASGIDGVVSSALGAALALDRPVAALVGDVALLHDIGGLLAASLFDVDLTVMVPNNDGGGIFSLLPIADGGPEIYFEELFHAPHDVSLCDLAHGLGVCYHQIKQADELADVVAKASGVTVVEVPIDHRAAIRQRKQLSNLTE